MRHGFKAEARRLALELRSEIGLDAHVPIDPYALAKQYGVPVVALSQLPCEERHHFLQADGTFSGALIPIGTGRAILENDAHRPSRRRTTMCHEMAHVVLEHDFGMSLSLDERKCGLGGVQEEEADWLSGEILLPTDGAFRLATRDASHSDAATAFDVSLAVARWRMNASGARTVIGRARQKYVQRSR